MTIIIDNKSGVPIYDQIYSQIKAQIIGDALRQDEALPSIRSLAKDLRISVITTKRAYDELEAEGFIYTLPGKGSFVCDGDQAARARRQELLERFEKMVKEMEQLGIPRRQLMDILKEGENQ